MFKHFSKQTTIPIDQFSQFTTLFIRQYRKIGMLRQSAKGFTQQSINTLQILYNFQWRFGHDFWLSLNWKILFHSAKDLKISEQNICMKKGGVQTSLCLIRMWQNVVLTLIYSMGKTFTLTPSFHTNRNLWEKSSHILSFICLAATRMKQDIYNQGI